MPERAPFRARLQSGAPMIGTFVKIPHPQVVELLAGTGLDFVVLDAEHAAFGTAALDACLMAARLMDLAALVRVPSLDAAAIGAALDMGAAGVVIPHILSRETADAAVRAAQYAGGARGLSGSHRAASYGREKLADYVRRADEEVVIVAQLEDGCCLDAIEAIVGADRIDCFFIGRTDLTLSLGESDAGSPRLEQAVARLASAVLAAGKPLGTFLAGAGEVERHIGQGYRFLTVGTDQALLTTGAEALVSRSRP